MSRPVVIALDGPAGAGKSTVGERLASNLGFFYFDTGVLYRAVALDAIRSGVDPGDELALRRLMEKIDVVVCPPVVGSGQPCQVLLDGEDVTDELRAAAVDANVSTAAASPAVRAGLIELQRRQVQGAGTVMAGRDIGTVVFPDADLKIFLVASPLERARRRVLQTGARLDELSDVLAAIEQRDRIDSTRSLAPLAKAADAEEIDTDGLHVDEVVSRVEELLRARLSKRG